MRRRAVRSVPPEDRSARSARSATRIVPAACRSRCAGSAIPAGHTLPPDVPGLLRRVRHAAPVGLPRRIAGRLVAGHHRRVAVGVHSRARERLVRRLDRLRPHLQRRARGRVRGAGGGRVPAAHLAGEATAARPHVPRHRAHLVRHAVVSRSSSPIRRRARAASRARWTRTARSTCLRFDQIIANRGTGPGRDRVAGSDRRDARPDRALPRRAAHPTQRRRRPTIGRPAR